MANLPPSWRPKRLQNRRPTAKKSMSKMFTFLKSIFWSFGPRFGRIFGRFFERTTFENNKNMIIAKTLKIVLPSRRDANFQEIEDQQKLKNQTKINDR